MSASGITLIAARDDGDDEAGPRLPPPPVAPLNLIAPGTAGASTVPGLSPKRVRSAGGAVVRGAPIFCREQWPRLYSWTVHT
jgi:hypothetical protein